MSQIELPKLSVVVVVYKMPEQARKTLISLCTSYQRNADLEQIEFIVIENQSSDLLGEQSALEVNPAIRYFLREEHLPSPVPALNFGWQQARANHVALMIDGARMLSPGVLDLCLQSITAQPDGIVTVPGYHLGERLQQESAADGYDSDTENELLNSINWPEDGYQLFDIACLSGSCRSGYILPMSESNFLVLSRNLLMKLEGFDPAFDSHGGGFANLDLYKRALSTVKSKVNVLFGEGTFHQFHGGATTGGVTQSERDDIMLELRNQYENLRGENFSPPDAQPVFLGSLHESALRFLQHSLECRQRKL